MFHESSIDFCKTLQDSGIGEKLFAHLNEGSDDKDAHANSFRAAEDGRGHDRSMLGESPRKRFGELDLSEVVSICDHLFFLIAGQLKQKILWKAVYVPFHLFIQPFSGDAVYFRKIGIQQDFSISDCQNQGFEWFNGFHDFALRTYSHHHPTTKGLKPFFLAIDIGLDKFLVRFGQVHNAFDDPYNVHRNI